MKARLNDLKITYGNIAMDKWQSFVEVFGSEKSNIGKKYTEGIEGNNCRLRHRIRWIKKSLYYFKAFNLAFHDINYGFVQPGILFRPPPDQVKDFLHRAKIIPLTFQCRQAAFSIRNVRRRHRNGMRQALCVNR